MITNLIAEYKLCVILDQNKDSEMLRILKRECDGFLYMDGELSLNLRKSVEDGVYDYAKKSRIEKGNDQVLKKNIGLLLSILGRQVGCEIDPDKKLKEYSLKEQLICQTLALVAAEGRGLIIKATDLGIDQREKWVLFDFVKEICDRTQMPVVIVTNCVEDAFYINGYTMVCRDGSVIQGGSNQELYKAPVNAYVASMIGYPAMSVLDVSLASSGSSTVLVVFGGRSFAIKGDRAIELQNTYQMGTTLKMAVRPEDVQIVGEDEEGAEIVHVQDVYFAGGRQYVTFYCGDDKLVAEAPGELVIGKNDMVGFVLRSENILFFRE